MSNVKAGRCAIKREAAEPSAVRGQSPEITPPPAVGGYELAGADFDTLFATCGDKVFKRKLKVRGVPAFLPPVKPAPPRL